jgi:hypothetical protein
MTSTIINGAARVIVPLASKVGPMFGQIGKWVGDMPLLGKSITSAWNWMGKGSMFAQAAKGLGVGFLVPKAVDMTGQGDTAIGKTVKGAAFVLSTGPALAATGSSLVGALSSRLPPAAGAQLAFKGIT